MTRDDTGRYSLAVVISAALAGTAVGSLTVFAIAGITWKVRVELPPPPYPPAVSSAPSAPTSGGLPLPPPPR
jgi:hypothetical protein